LPFTASNTIVRTFRHAVSLDERRAKFKANLWNRPSAEEAEFCSKAESTFTNTATKAPSSISPAALHDARDFILRKGLSPTDIFPADILPPSLRPPAKTADTKGGDTLNYKDSKTLNSNFKLDGHTKSQKRRHFKKEDTGDRELNILERMYSEKNEGTTDIEEVWFAVRVIFLSLLEW
jgi:uncharacterized protein (DUF2235 family)